MIGVDTLKEIKALAKKYWIGIILCLISMIVLNRIFHSVCYSTILFGIPCPACGMTRATILLLTGHFRESFQMHPLLLLFIFELIFCLCIKKILNNYRFFINISVILCMVIFVSFYIYRMKMNYPNIAPMVYRQDNYLHKILIFLHKCRLQ